MYLATLQHTKDLQSASKCTESALKVSNFIL